MESSETFHFKTQVSQTAADHEKLASHYEAESKIFEEKVDAHKKLPDHFEREPWLMGRQGIDFENHCKKLIQIYSQAKDANLEMAKMHRELAAGAKP